MNNANHIGINNYTDKRSTIIIWQKMKDGFMTTKRSLSRARLLR